MTATWLGNMRDFGHVEGGSGLGKDSYRGPGPRNRTTRKWTPDEEDNLGMRMHCRRNIGVLMGGGGGWGYGSRHRSNLYIEIDIRSQI